ncbi:MAG: response regulator [Phycisphaeraceae bacterium]|nr:response regulator [Phycisphaeraceae bacterium]
MEDRALCYTMYAVIPTIASCASFFAMYRRQVNEGVPINYSIIKTLLGFSVLIWLAVVFSNLFYNRSITNASIAEFSFVMIFSLFAAWHFNTFVQNVLSKLGTAIDKDAVSVVPTIEDAEKAGELVLLAEDHAVNQVVISKQLNRLGYAVEVADDGRQALTLMENRSYGLLLTDIQMPNLDGLRLSSFIRAKEKEHNRKRMPILAVTGKALKYKSEIYSKSGMDAVLTKPLELALLKENLEEHLHQPASRVEHKKEDVKIESAVDLDVLKSIVGDDQDIILRLFTLFITSSPDTIAEIHLAFTNQASHEIEKLGHKLKTSSQSVGAVQFSALCLELEEAGSEDNWDRLNQLNSQLDQKFDDVLTFIQIYQNP